MKTNLAKLGLVAAVCVVAAVVVQSMRRTAASTKNPDPASAGPPAGVGRDAPFLDGNLIRFSESFARRAGIAAVPVRTATLKPNISVTGTVAFDPHQFAAVGVRISGRVRRVFKTVGDRVGPHTTLAEVESAELGRAEALVSGARAKEMAAEADMKRERQLASSHISSEREAEAANAHFESARAERIAAEHAVKALGGDLRGEIGILEIRSPIAGRVVSSKIARGQTVDPDDTVYEIAELTSVWVELKVFERDLAAIRVGDAVQITTPFRAEEVLPGRVAHVGDVIEPTTRSAPVRVVVDNPNNALRPGQSVNARISTKAPAAKMLLVPRTAVTRIDGKPTVFVLGAGVVEPRAVELGPADREDVGVLSGLSEGQQVVVGGLLALKSEIFR